MSSKTKTGMARRLMKRYRLPKGCSVETFILRELDVNDDIEVQIWADKNTPEVAKDSATAMFSSQQREAMRLALVEVDGTKVNRDGVPYLQMNQWTIKTLKFLQMAFFELNGATEEEMQGFKKAGEVVTDDDETPAQPEPAQATPLRAGA